MKIHDIHDLSSFPHIFPHWFRGIFGQHTMNGPSSKSSFKRLGGTTLRPKNRTTWRSPAWRAEEPRSQPPAAVGIRKWIRFFLDFLGREVVESPGKTMENWREDLRKIQNLEMTRHAAVKWASVDMPEKGALVVKHGRKILALKRTSIHDISWQWRGRFLVMNSDQSISKLDLVLGSWWVDLNANWSIKTAARWDKKTHETTSLIPLLGQGISSHAIRQIFLEAPSHWLQESALQSWLLHPRESEQRPRCTDYHQISFAMPALETVNSHIGRWS